MEKDDATSITAGENNERAKEDDDKVWTFTSHSPGMKYCSLAVMGKRKRDGCQWGKSGLHSRGDAMRHIYTQSLYMTKHDWRYVTAVSREARGYLRVHGNVDKKKTVMMLIGGKYLAVAREEWHEGKTETVRKTGRKGKKKKWSKKKKMGEKHVDSCLRRLRPNKRGYKEVWNLSSVQCQTA